LCFVSPLVLGAGIKIKILEIMSSGVPVIANSISLEGINAIKNIHYVGCETSIEYINAIKKFNEDNHLCDLFGNAGKEFVMQNFDYRKKTDIYLDSVLK
jgi:glycosyltransferase involved in cell wall biosynthesis